MRARFIVHVLSTAAVTAWLALSTTVQGQPGSPTRVLHVAVARDRDRPALVSRSARGGPPGWSPQRTAPSPAQAAAADWPLHNLDLANSRYSPLSEINVSNVGQLRQKWSYPAGVNIGEVTPLVVDGVMYFNAGSRLFAINAATGTLLWDVAVRTSFPGSGRGPAIGDNRVYAYGSTSVYAVEAKTGAPSEAFGDHGVLAIVRQAMDFKYPGKYPPELDPKDLGFRPLTTPPTYYRGTVFVGLSHSDSHIPGGWMIAADATTGAIKWVFNTVPQGPADEGWELAKDTWVGGIRHGGGIWTAPAIDPELGLIYFNSTNTSPTFDGSARKGMNLFTNSIVALDISTGKLKWFYQTLHHDIWDWDLVSGPVLFDVTQGGRTIKGIGAPGKTCYLYLLDRATGTPINPIVESPVPTKTDVPGEEPWPTQPIPYTSKGIPQQPFCAIYPAVTDKQLLDRVRPIFHPYMANEFVITSPGNTGGANYGPPSFSPRTGLFYVTGKNDAYSIKVKPVGSAMSSVPPPGTPPDRATAIAFVGTIAAQGQTSMTPSMSVSAYNPATGDRVWQVEIPKTTNSGNLVTAGDLVFQGLGTEIYAFDARSGKQVFQSTVTGGIRASPLTYQAGGKQHVAIVSGNTIFSFALPDRASPER
jgi:glucose dehydrogenase